LIFGILYKLKKEDFERPPKSFGASAASAYNLSLTQAPTRLLTEKLTERRRLTYITDMSTSF
jgi:hypothetical protein